LKLSIVAFATALSLLSGTSYSQSAAPAKPGATSSAFKTPLEATSYAVGVDMVRNFKAQNVSFDQAQLIQGIKDASAGGKLLMGDAEVKQLVSSLETDVRNKMVSARKAEGEANLKKTEEFLKANGARPGVVTLASGLQYKIEKVGTGPKAVEESSVVANYKGSLADGSVFDASEPGKPVTLKVAQVVTGWKEALKLMPAGSKWELVLPPSLAYGERGAGRVIGPNQALRFELEVLEVR
jgi:FKBP-type peptidyl-prolyl cis-trans isomerase FklB